MGYAIKKRKNIWAHEGPRKNIGTHEGPKVLKKEMST
jgi:hypothetical protein